MQLLCVFLMCLSLPSQAATHKVVSGYYEGSLLYQGIYPKQIATSGGGLVLNTLIYAFAEFNSSGTQCALADPNADINYQFTSANSVNGTNDSGSFAGNFHQLQELKAKFPNLKILVSIGGAGGTVAANFSTAASPANVQSFVQSCINTFIDGNFANGITQPGIFDGFDIDWEFPGSTDNYAGLLSEFHNQLHAISPNLMLTAATAPLPSDYQYENLATIASYINYYNVLTYDYTWSTAPKTGFVSPLSYPAGDPWAGSVEDTVNDYIAANVPANQILIGMPFYAYNFINVPNSNNGLYQSGTPNNPSNQPAHTYAGLASLSGYTAYRDQTTNAPWLFNGSSFWTYDDPISIATKVNYGETAGLGGYFAWDLGFDTNGASLLKTMSALQFVPVTPCRVVDTRNANGTFGGPELAANSSRDFPVPSSACGIPSTAAAYSVNVTAVPNTTLEYLTIWPSGSSQPVVSTLNSFDGRIKANAAIVPAGYNGAVSVYATDATQFVMDIDGYFLPANTSAGELAFYPLTPCRIADTRNQAGPLGGPSLTGGSPGRAFPVMSSSCNIPASAQAYSLNFTALPKSTLEYITVWPTGQNQPLVSTLNAPTGAYTANAAIVPAGSSGEVSVYASDNTDLVIDVNGYFAAPGAGGLSLYTTTPCRVLDSRQPSGNPPMNGEMTVAIAGNTCEIPSTAQAYVLNATVVPPNPLGYLTLWPNGASQPLVSTLNAIDGAVTSNMAIVPTTNGSVNAFGSNPTYLILDVSSYFAP